MRPSGSLGRWLLAQSLYELTWCDSAAEHLKICAQEIDSVKYKAKILLARCYYDRKNYPASIITFLEVKKEQQLSFEDLNRLATAAFQVGDSNSAVQYYKEVIDRDSSQCKTIYQIGLLQYKRKEFKDAINLLDKKIRLCKDDLISRSYYFIGLSYFYMSSPDSVTNYYLESEKAFIDCLKADSTNIYAKIYLGDVYVNLKDKGKAKQIYNEVIEEASKDTVKNKDLLTQAYSKICSMYYEEKNFKEVRNISKNWADFDNNSLNANIFLAVAYHQLQETESACKAYAKVLRLDPKNKTALTNRKLLECK